MTTQVVFGVGVLTGVRTDIANATPRRFGVLQEVSVDEKFDIKKLYGENRFPVDIAQAEGSITGKAKLGRFSGRLVSELFYGIAPTTGLLIPIMAESAVVPTTPFTVTVANTTGYADDGGVMLAATGQQLERVASAPAAGQYSVNTSTGVYTFNTAQQGATVLIDYTFAQASPVAPANRQTLSNTAMGAAPAIELRLAVNHRGRTLWRRFFQVMLSGHTFGLKNNDYSTPEITFECFADAAGRVAEWSSAG